MHKIMEVFGTSLVCLTLLGLGWWTNSDFMIKELGELQGQVNAEINVNGNAEKAKQELHPIAPGVLGAGVSLDKDINVNGQQIHASSSST